MLTFYSSSVLPYACGYDRCWATDASSSSSCFAMSKDLSEHVKTHESEESDRPFRCGLAGCGKSWKVSNLLSSEIELTCPAEHQWASVSSSDASQLYGGRDGLFTSPFFRSTAHFRQALSTRFSTSIASSIDVTDPEPADGEDAAKTARKFICKLPGCFKAYRQLSGLRYHRKHVGPIVSVW